MANPDTPFGLQLYQRDGAADFRASLNVYKVAAGTTNAMYVGDPVIKLTASADVNGINGVNLATAGTGNSITGVICGFLGVGTAQLGSSWSPSFFGLSATPGPAYKPANAVDVYYVLVCDDPDALFVIQSDDGGGDPASTIVGRNANLASGAGSPYTGWSGWQLDVSTIGTTASNQMQVVGVLQEADNVVGTTQTDGKFIVKINRSTVRNNAVAGI
jgi:hypothetical protein